MMSEFSEQDCTYMRRALELAAKGKGSAEPNPMVGCVIVKNGRIIGEGYHMKFGEAHAEVNAIRNSRESVEGATMYVTLEPCSHYGKTPPCADLVIKSKLGRVVVAMIDPNPLVSGKGIEKIKAANIEVIVGLLQKEAETLIDDFIQSIKKDRANPTWS
jgi:diaminohydroxyphosphoribosylaminopyrimidine deaminase/5-amino-6-(5-phosphoribosylamino)uracil reductase